MERASSFLFQSSAALGKSIDGQGGKMRAVRRAGGGFGISGLFALLMNTSSNYFIHLSVASYSFLVLPSRSPRRFSMHPPRPRRRSDAGLHKYLA